MEHGNHSQITTIQAQKSDMRRAGMILVPIFLLLTISILYVILYVQWFNQEWLPQEETRIQKITWLFRIFLSISTPIIAFIVITRSIFKVSNNFVTALFVKDENKQIAKIIWKRLLGVPLLPPPLSMFLKYPMSVIKETTFDDKNGITWIGGPSSLTVYDGNALYVEKGNKFSRVIGPGKPPGLFLDRYEVVREVVDLRPQIREGMIKTWSKDGIQIKISVRIECQIDAVESGLENSPNLVYPFDGGAVKTVVEHTRVGKNAKTQQHEELNWVEGVWGQATGFIRNYTMSHSLDELFLGSREQLFGSQESKSFINKINTQIREMNLGARLNNLQLTSIVVPEDVKRQRFNSSNIEKERYEKIRKSEVDADRIRLREAARAATQHEMLNTITERLRQVGKDNMTEPILLSLTGILDQNLDDPLVRPLIAKESISLLERIRTMLKEGF